MPWCPNENTGIHDCHLCGFRREWFVLHGPTYGPETWNQWVFVYTFEKITKPLNNESQDFKVIGTGIERTAGQIHSLIAKESANIKPLVFILLLLMSLSSFAGGSTHHNRGHKAKKVRSTYFSAKHFCNNSWSMRCFGGAGYFFMISGF
jgi:hypothetical protein